jgi:4-hydroxybenzoate polyprenyltransferase
MRAALLEFLRIKLLPSAWADIAAGALLAGTPAPVALAGALALTSGLYLFGMASNALLDRVEDARRYPSRPLPSGRLGLGAARALCAACLIAAFAGGAFVEPAGRAVAGALLAAILAYNLGGKRVAVLGPALMGSCRALNLLAGALAAVPGALLDERVLVPALALGLYVACVTSLSALEGAAASRARLGLRFGAMLAVPCALFPFAGPASALALGALAALIAAAFPRAAFAAGAHDERPVHRLLAGIYLLDAAFAGHASAPWLCAALAAAGTLHFLTAGARGRVA